jgi:hypothetical protein
MRQHDVSTCRECRVKAASGHYTTGEYGAKCPPTCVVCIYRRTGKPIL